jgi:ABC-type sugar transport system, permease component
MMHKKHGYQIFVYVFLIITFALSIFPFYWMLTGMTNSAVDVVKGKMTFGNELNHNLNTLLSQYNIRQIFYNSAKIAILTVIGQLLISSLAAFSFEFYRSKIRERIYTLVLLTMMVPFAALMIPLFQLMVKVGLINTHIGVVIFSLVSVFLIFFFRQSFRSFPKDIIHAARVDGAGEFRILFSIVAPSMKATYAAGAIYSFMVSWNSYMWPLVALQSPQKKTMQLLISTMSSAYYPDSGAIMTAITISTLPMIVIFFTLQRYFVQGITGSVKQ